jgi:hypothetical protein
VVRVINVPDECFIPYSKKGSKRNRIYIVIPGLTYTYIGDGRPYIVNTLNGPREEPRASILEGLKTPKGFVKHNGLYVVSQGDGYDTSPKEKEAFMYEPNFERTPEEAEGRENAETIPGQRRLLGVHKQNSGKHK